MPVAGSFLVISRSEEAADFEWRISRSEIELFERGDWLWSPPLSFVGWEWMLLFKVSDPRSGSCPLGLRLGRHSGPSHSPPVLYWLGAVKVDGGREEEEIGRGRSEPCSSVVYHPWLPYPELRRRMRCSAPSGTLSVIARLRTGPETASILNDASACDVSRGLEGLSSDLSKMLDDETTSDVKLSCNERTIFAHKNILAARSEVFAAMFRNKMVESETGTVNLSDMDVSIFELFAKYLYSGKVLDLSEDNVSGLYDAADIYAVRELKEECSRWIRRNLMEENCFGFLILAEAHGDQAMKDAMVGYFLKNMELLNSERWRLFSDQHPKLSNYVYQKCFSEKFLK